MKKFWKCDMKSFTCSALTVIALLAGCKRITDSDSPVHPHGYYKVPSDHSQLKLVWSEEFNGTELDTSKWSGIYGNGFTDANGIYHAGFGIDEQQYLTNHNENVHLDSGYLVITAIKEKYVSEDHGSFDYTSALICSHDKYTMQNGRIDVRAKLPSGQGLLPAIWMTPAGYSTYEMGYYGTWAASGEIDIMEARGDTTNKVIGTIHYGGAWSNNTDSKGTFYFPENESIEDFHIYSLEWDYNEIRWYVDNELFSTQRNWYSKNSNGEVNAYPAPFDKPFRVLLAVYVGGGFAGPPF